MNDAQEILKHEKFDATKKTVLYIHGYLENPEVESIHVIVDAYLTRDDCNIIILDWGLLADGNYMLDAVVNAKQLGPVIAKVLIGMFDNGLDINRFHLVGHSLGGQVSGIVGREIFKRSEKTKKLKRFVFAFYIISYNNNLFGDYPQEIHMYRIRTNIFLMKKPLRSL